MDCLGLQNCFYLFQINVFFLYFRYRLQPYASDLQAAEYMMSIIRQSFLNFRTKAYDILQYQQNQITY